MNEEQQATKIHLELIHIGVDAAEENARKAKVHAELTATDAARELIAGGRVDPETLAMVAQAQAEAAAWRAVADATYRELHTANQEAGL